MRRSIAIYVPDRPTPPEQWTNSGFDEFFVFMSFLTVNIKFNKVVGDSGDEKSSHAIKW